MSLVLRFKVLPQQIIQLFQRVGHFTIAPRTLQDEDQIVVCKPQTKNMLRRKVLVCELKTP